MTPEQERNRGDEAKRLLENPLWVEAWDAGRAALLKRMEDAAQTDVDAVMGAKAVLAGMTIARQYLERIVKDGAMAANSIEQAGR